jgi:lysophospholipase L1-like esterase
MKMPVDRTTAATLIALLGLASLQVAAQAGHSLPGLAGEVVATLTNRDLNQEGREALTAGYYEGLINEGARLGGMNRLVTDSRKFTIEDPAQPDRRRVREFLYYELIPNADVPDYADARARYRLKTNAHGLSDQAYEQAKPAGTRRLALLGDSITRGQGAPYQENYEALLEAALNQERTQAGQGPLEIVNFAVGSYTVMQMMDTALTKAALFEPDVYVVALTDRCVYRSWGEQLALLQLEGIDLKYDYLRTVVREAGVTVKDPRGVFDAKMARHRIPTIRWSLETIRDHARSRGASMLVLLVPTADDPKLLEEEFIGVREMLAELGVPVIDLLNTFAGIGDRSAIRVAERDRHPNREGHQLLYEALAREIKQSPEAFRVVHGMATLSAAATTSAQTKLR